MREYKLENGLQKALVDFLSNVLFLTSQVSKLASYKSARHTMLHSTHNNKAKSIDRRKVRGWYSPPFSADINMLELVLSQNRSFFLFQFLINAV